MGVAGQPAERKKPSGGEVALELGAHLAVNEAEYSELLCDFLHRGPASLPPPSPAAAAGPQGLEKGSDKALHFERRLKYAYGGVQISHKSFGGMITQRITKSSKVRITVTFMVIFRN